MLTHTSILDIKYREIEPKIWLIYLPLIIFLYFNIQKLNLTIYLISLIITNLLVYILYKLSMLGGADVIATALLSLGNSSVSPLIYLNNLVTIGLEPLVLLLYSSLIIAIVGIINFARNFKYTKNMKIYDRILLAFNGKRMKVKDFITSKFYFPLTIIDEKGNISIRTNFSIEEDDKYWRDMYRELVKKGIISEDEYIWVSWGVPVLPFISIGYIVSIIIGFPIYQK
ncbi:MAG: A24 family peptidase C-terminal domain-containing protein [Sulfolobaceae archaeon]